MKLSVIGVGYVGLVAAGCLAGGGNHVICIDKDKKRIDELNNGTTPIYEPGLAEIIKHNEEAGRLTFTTDLKYGIQNSLIIILAVGTPSTEDGSADISAVLSVAGEIAKYMKDYKIIVTKSTVPVGTYKKVNELITGKTKQNFDDFLKPDRVIIGTESPRAMDLMRQLYAPFMRKSSRMIFMDPASAEMTKYAANTMLATRISLMNELSALCEKFGADIEKVRVGIGSDSRIGSAFLFPGIGYGGSCFPKDIRALIHMGEKQGCPMTIPQAVQAANYTQQDRFAKRIIDYFGSSAGQRRLGVWGLAFKARTDDIRESPAIRCIEKLLEAGIKLTAYDPEAMPAALEKFDGRIDTTDDAYEALEGADGLVILTDWQEFRAPDFELILSKLKRPVIFDGRNLYDSNYVQMQGLEYHRIGKADVQDKSES